MKLLNYLFRSQRAPQIYDLWFAGSKYFRFVDDQNFAKAPYGDLLNQTTTILTCPRETREWKLNTWPASCSETQFACAMPRFVVAKLDIDILNLHLELHKSSAIQLSRLLTSGDVIASCSLQFKRVDNRLICMWKLSVHYMLRLTAIEVWGEK